MFLLQLQEMQLSLRYYTATSQLVFSYFFLLQVSPSALEGFTSLLVVDNMYFFFFFWFQIGCLTQCFILDMATPNLSQSSSTHDHPVWPFKANLINLLSLNSKFLGKRNQQIQYGSRCPPSPISCERQDVPIFQRASPLRKII